MEVYYRISLLFLMARNLCLISRLIYSQPVYTHLLLRQHFLKLKKLFSLLRVLQFDVFIDRNPIPSFLILPGWTSKFLNILQNTFPISLVILVPFCAQLLLYPSLWDGGDWNCMCCFRSGHNRLLGYCTIISLLYWKHLYAENASWLWTFHQDHADHLAEANGEEKISSEKRFLSA